MSLICAVIYGPDDDCDGLLTRFARDLMRSGVKVSGLVQINAGSSCAELDMELEALDTGRRINICQDLGSGSANACRLDPQGLAEAAASLRQALDKPTDLVVVNKFGRMESEGGGLIGGIGAAVEADLPLVIGLPARFREAWEAYSGDMAETVACSREALDAWWARRGLQVAAE
mgnify:FL=1